jgi:hypothetical protein
MKKVPYFSHDANARHDPKMTALISRYGMAGYGSFWVIVEMLREQEGYRLPHKSYAFEAIATELKMDNGKTTEFIQYLIKEVELLRSDEKFFWSESLLCRMKLMETKSEQARQAALTMHKKRRAKDADAMRPHS